MSESGLKSDSYHTHCKIKIIDIVIIATIILTYTVLFTYFSLLRYENFFTYNWDLGINQQLLWTTTHGHLMFESGDYISYGTKSFLEVHSAYIAYPIAYLYSLYPQPILLFSLQSLIIALGTIPLYLITRQFVEHRLLVFLILIVYLSNFGLVSAIFYDFHWEAFIPLELFWQYYLVSKKRFFLSLVPMTVGAATLEVYPFLSAFLILYFAIDSFGIHAFSVVSKIRDKLWVSYFLLFIGSAASYIIIRLIQVFVIFPLAGNVTSSSYTTFTGSVLNPFLPHIYIPGIELSIIYWALLYASFSYLSLKSPKMLVIQIPWIIESVILSSGFSSYYGDQYAFIAIPPVVLSFSISMGYLFSDNKIRQKWIFFAISAYMLAISTLPLTRNLLLKPDLGIYAYIIVMILSPAFLYRWIKRSNVHKNTQTSRKKRIRTNVGGKTIVASALVIIIVFNIIISPIDQSNYQATPMPGYEFSSTPNPAFSYAHNISLDIPKNSSVLSTDNLFPLVANNYRSFSSLWYPFNSSAVPFFPFNVTNLPEYVFASSSQYDYLPKFITNDIGNTSYYGLEYMVKYSGGYPGSIFLYRLHYHGGTTYFDVD